MKNRLLGWLFVLISLTSFVYSMDAPLVDKRTQNISAKRPPRRCSKRRRRNDARPVSANNIDAEVFSLEDDNDTDTEAPATYYKKTRVSESQIIDAVQKGNIAVLRLAQSQGVDLHQVYVECDGEIFSVMHFAALHGQQEVIEWLKENGFSIDEIASNGWNLMHSAARGGSQRTLEWLVTTHEFNIRQEARGENVLHLAARGGHRRLLEWLLLFPGANLNHLTSNGMSLLHIAALEGHQTLIAWLLENELFRISQPSKQGWSVLHYAAFGGHIGLIEWLVAQYGLNINRVTRNRSNILHFAALGGHQKVIEWLVNQCGFNIKKLTRSGYSVLHLAALGDHQKLIEWLVKHHGFDIKEETKKGKNILHLAVIKGNLEMIEWLVTCLKFDINKLDAKGFSPFDVAQSTGNEFLQNFIARLGGRSLRRLTLDQRIYLIQQSAERRQSEWTSAAEFTRKNPVLTHETRKRRRTQTRKRRRTKKSQSQQKRQRMTSPSNVTALIQSPVASVLTSSTTSAFTTVQRDSEPAESPPHSQDVPSVPVSTVSTQIADIQRDRQSSSNVTRSVPSSTTGTVTPVPSGRAERISNIPDVSSVPTVSTVSSQPTGIQRAEQASLPPQNAPLQPTRPLLQRVDMPTVTSSRSIPSDFDANDIVRRAFQSPNQIVAGIGVHIVGLLQLLHCVMEHQTP